MSYYVHEMFQIIKGTVSINSSDSCIYLINYLNCRKRECTLAYMNSTQLYVKWIF